MGIKLGINLKNISFIFINEGEIFYMKLMS